MGQFYSAPSSGVSDVDPAHPVGVEAELATCVHVGLTNCVSLVPGQDGAGRYTNARWLLRRRHLGTEDACDRPP